MSRATRRLLADEQREEADGELGWHRCPAVTHGRRRTRPRGRAGGEGAGGEQEKPEVAGDIDGAWCRGQRCWGRAADGGAGAWLEAAGARAQARVDVGHAGVC
jgi:hypothetical protein